jgi:xylulokinase
MARLITNPHDVNSDAVMPPYGTELPPEDILAIATTSQWSVTVAVDDQANPLMNAISWMDTRGGKYNLDLVRGFPSLQGYQVRKLFKWIDIVGYPPLPDGSDSIAHILFLKHERPDIYQRAYKFLEPMDFINFRLTGNACSTQCSNIACLSIDNRKDGSGDYHPWILAQTGIDRAKLPDLIPVESIVGTLLPLKRR